MRGKVIRGYPKYCIDTIGNIFYTEGAKTRKKPELINGKHKYVLKSEIQGKRSLLDLEQCICLAYFPHYEYGDTIIFKDGNTDNIKLSNLNIKKARTVDLYNSNEDVSNINSWGLKSKCRSANGRTSLGKLFVGEIYKALQILQFKCFYCQEDLKCNDWHLDHFLPICQGGTNDFKNIRPSCPTCNMMKGRMTLPQFRNRINILFTSLKEIGDGTNG